MCLHSPCRGRNCNWMPVIVGRQLLEPIHKKAAISVNFSSKVYSVQEMPAMELFLWECYLLVAFKIRILLEWYKHALLIFFKTVFFNKPLGQCQKSAFIAKKKKKPKPTKHQIVISLTTWGRWCVVWMLELKPVSSLTSTEISKF